MRKPAFDPLTSVWRKVLLAAGGVAIVVAWAAARTLFVNPLQRPDVPLYREYGEAVLSGQVPYRDFALEYPPAALPAFVLPALVTSSIDGFRTAFELTMVLCAFGLLVAVEAAAKQLRLSRARTAGAVAFLVLAPPLLGFLVFGR